MKNVFDPNEVAILKSRIANLSSETKPQWGKMNVSQMLAHCSVAYELTYHPDETNTPKGLKKWLLKTFLKPLVVGPRPYRKNSATSKAFLVADNKEFEAEKSKLVAFIDQTCTHGAAYFHNKENTSFGKLTSQEWSNLFYKHLDHHLTQFGV